MSGPFVNIQRDGSYVKVESAAGKLSFPAGNDPTSATLIVNAKTTVFDMYGYAQLAPSKYSIIGDQLNTIGLYMDPPRLDRYPYRVKVSVAASDSIGQNVNMVLIVGYAPETIVGLDDEVAFPQYIPFRDTMDDLIIIEPLPSGDALEDRPLYFGLGVQPIEDIASDHVYGHISVQNLGIRPPTMHNAIS